MTAFNIGGAQVVVLIGQDYEVTFADVTTKKLIQDSPNFLNRSTPTLLKDEMF